MALILEGTYLLFVALNKPFHNKLHHVSPFAYMELEYAFCVAHTISPRPLPFSPSLRSPPSPLPHPRFSFLFPHHPLSSLFLPPSPPPCAFLFVRPGTIVQPLSMPDAR
eukprot:2990495-Rhodomonas_salina.3